MAPIQKHSRMIRFGLCLCLGLAVTSLTDAFQPAEPAGRPSRTGGGTVADTPARPRPATRATPELLRPFERTGTDAESAWRRPPFGDDLRLGPVLLYDNGMHLDDLGQPPSQLSIDDVGDPDFTAFNAAAADDFVLPESMDMPGANFRILLIRAGFVFFEVGAENATPKTTWTNGIDVVVYANSVLNLPDGLPNGDGTFSNFVALENVPASSLIELSGTGECFPFFVVDIPVDFTLAPETRYWLSLVPRFPFPPESFWCLSDANTGFAAHQGILPGVAFWTEIMGNLGAFECPSSPAPETFKDVSFQLFGEETLPILSACCDESAGTCRDVTDPADCNGPFETTTLGQECQFVQCVPVTGACCDETTGLCSDAVNIANCQAPGERFEPGVACGALAVPCTISGTCCHEDGTCDDGQEETNCMAPGDLFFPGLACADILCPPAPVNDDCANATVVSDGMIPFDTTNAMTDGPADSPGGDCTDVNQDIWFRYTAPCSGLLTASLCNTTNYDAALAVYEGCFCPPSGNLIGCDDDGCGPANGAAEVLVRVVSGSCYLIRVGGAGAAVGSGELFLDCFPLPPCCPGDVNLDGRFDLDDVPFMVDALLVPPFLGSFAFCAADVNEDHSVDGDDLQPFVDRFLSGFTCQPLCCLGDVNGDDLITIDDVVSMVAALLAPPDIFAPEFCRADINEDRLIDGRDVQPFVEVLLLAEPCTPPITGACCFIDGACQEETEDDCLTLGGVFQGDNTTCAPNPCPQPPPNDECINAIALSCNTQITFDTAQATSDPSDPNVSCRFGGPGPGVGTVWFTFVAEEAEALLSLCNTQGPVTDTILAVYDAAGGCPATPADEIACNEDACGRLSEVCVTGLVPGTVYTILVASFDAASQGLITLDLVCPCPRGACCLPDQSCQTLRPDECTSSGGEFQGDGVACNPGLCLIPPPVECCLGDFNVDGVIDTLDAPFFADALIHPPALGSPEFCFADLNRDLLVDANDLEDFVARVLSPAPCPPPSNDDCAGAEPIECNSVFLIQNTGATTDPADPPFSCRIVGANQGVGTVWFAFVAEANAAFISVCGSALPVGDTLLAVYDAACPAEGNEIACSDDALGCGRLSEVCAANLVPGNTYFIQVSSFDENNLGMIELEIVCPCP